MKKMIAILIVLAIVFSIIPLTVNAEADTKDEVSEIGKDLAETIGDEGIVLMKNNNNALPLANGSKLAVFGEAQHMWIYGSSVFNTEDESCNVNTLTYQHGYIPWGAGSSRSSGVGGVANKIDPLDALKAAEENGRIDIYDELSDKYVEALENSYHPSNYTEYIPDTAMYQSASAFADTAIVMLRRWDGECVDMNATVNNIALPNWELTADEIEMLQNVSQNFDKVIVILNTPGPIDTSWSIDGNELGIDVDAVLFVGYGGMQGGSSIVNVLLGDVNPSGKLVDTWAKELEDYPTTESFVNDLSYQAYTEDIYLGYRYFETFNIPVNYPFGYGLSYTSFDITTSDFAVSDGVVSVKATVKNTGVKQGKEVVQMYVSAPQGVLGKPSRALCAFDKTSLLMPGESETLTLSVELNDLASYDDTGKTEYKSAYVLEAGDYKFYVGNSVKGDILAGTHNIASLQLVEQLSEQCPTNLEKRLLADGSFEILNEAVEDIPLLERTVTVEAEDWYAFVPVTGYPTFTGKTELASNAKLYNADTKTYDNYSCTAIVDTYKVQSVTYKVNVAEAGSYRISLRLAPHNTDTATASVLYSTDNSTFTTVATLSQASTKAASGSSYHGYIDKAGSAAFDMAAGICYIRLTFGSGGAAPNVDSFTITSTKKYLDNDKVLVIEAEDYDSTTASGYAVTENISSAKLYNASTDTWDSYTCRNLCNTYKSYYVTYNVYVSEAGFYGFGVRAAANKSDGRVATITLTDSDNTTLATATTTKTFDESGNNYYGFKDFTSAKYFKLEKGLNELSFTFSCGPNVDLFTLFSADFNIPLSEEKEFNVGYFETMHKEMDSFVYNGTNLDTMYRKGNYVEYKVVAPLTGKYTFNLKYSTARTNDSVSISTTVDKVTYSTGATLTTPSTSGWSASTAAYTASGVEITLQEGVNYIRITSIQAPNIFAFKLAVKADYILSYFANDAYEYGDNSAKYDLKKENFSGSLYDGTSWNTYSGTNFVNLWVSGGYILYVVNAPVAGTYNLYERLATFDTASAKYSMSYDGSLWSDLVTQTLSNTYTEHGSQQYASYKDFLIDTVELKKGTNFIKLQFSGSLNFAGLILEMTALAGDQTENNPIIEPAAKASYYQLSDVVNGTVTMEAFVAQMTTSELATFFVSHSGYNFGGSQAVQAKYGIKGAVFSDGPSGLSNNATSFPCETIIASTWNIDLAEAMGKTVGAEGRIGNVDVWAAPAMNLHRNPLEGRNSEYYSEDSFLTAQMGLATVKGAQSYGTITVLKHFVLNEKESNKLSCDSRVSERALREVYLKPFEVCIKEGNAKGIMSSYNLINGEPVTEKYDLLTNILREEWGYEYYISGDWNNNKNMINEINAGNGVREPAGYCDINKVIAAIQAHEISRETLEAGTIYELNTLKEINSYYKTYDKDICNGAHTYVDGVCTRCRLTDGSISLTESIESLVADEYTTYIYGASVELGATLTANLYVNLTKETLGAQVRFTRNGKAEVVDGVYDATNMLYKFAYAGITPQCMTDNIVAELILDQTVIATKEFSVKSYCDTLYASDKADEGIKALVTATLAYGAAAQGYVGYNSESPASTADISSFTASKPTGVTKTVLVAATGEDNKVLSAGLVFDNQPKIYFKVKLEGTTDVYLDNNKVTVVDEGDAKYVYTTGILSTDFDKPFTLTLKDGNTVLHSVEYSINTYLKNKWDTENAKLLYLVRAMNEYGTAAEAYASSK